MFLEQYYSPITQFSLSKPIETEVFFPEHFPQNWNYTNIHTEMGVYKTKTEDRRPKTEDWRPKNEDPNFFAPIRHGKLKNQAKAFLSANRCENNGDLRFVEKTPWIYKTKTLTKTLC